MFTPNTAERVQLLAQSTVAIQIEVVTHKSTVTKKTESSPLFSTSKDLVAIIPNLSVPNAFLVVLPESLNATSTFVLVS